MGKMQAVQEIINVFVASVVSLAVLFILTRLGGKRQIAQMNLFDYVNSITIGSIAAEMATNLEQWYRPLTAMIVYVSQLLRCITAPAKTGTSAFG